MNKLKAEQGHLKTVFEEICKISAVDGVVFKYDSIKVEAIQKEGNCSGTRIRIEASLGKTAQQIQIDIEIGDHITPGPQEIEFPTILKELPPPILDAYSIETLVSEKFNAIIDLL